MEVLAGADKVRVGYHAEKDGLLMWEGSYLSRTAESVFSWGVVTEMTENLIERGAYKIKLGLQNAPVMAEQMSLFGMGGGTAVYEVPETQRTGELFPTRPVPQAVIDQTLYTAGNSRGSAERIAVFFMRQRPEAECIAFLRREFGTENGRGIEYEGKKYAVWFMEDGIHLAQGDSVRTGHSRTTVTWEQASARILELLEAGTYLSASELERAQDKVLLEMGDALLMTARDLAQEGRAQGLFPQTLAIHDQHKGYPELDEDMVAFAKSEGGLAVLAEEYHDFLRAYEQNRMLTPEAMQIGSYRGLTLELSFDSFSQEYRLTMIGQLRHVVTLGTDVFGNIQRMDNLLESLPLKEQACREKLSDLHNQLETARVEVLKPFPREEELQAKLARLEELNALLNMDKREPEVVAETEAPDNSQQSPTRKTTELER